MRYVLSAQPLVRLVALLSLTLGIGATSAIFSVIYGVLIAPYRYAKPGEIWAPDVPRATAAAATATPLTSCGRFSEVPAFADVMVRSTETVS